MYRYPVYFVNAFTSQLFGGNPAAVCPLEQWLPDATLQAIAAQHNLSETAFFVGAGNRYHLRWFTPTCEVDLCGHATLATLSVLHGRQPETRRLVFDTRSGKLEGLAEAGRLTLDFPAYLGWQDVDLPVIPGVAAMRQAVAVTSLVQSDLLLELADVEAVRAARPDMASVAALPYRGLILTAPGKDGVDFVSRFFAPRYGIAEDPVTGSAHCLLTPYWAERLGKPDLQARQLSARGGDLQCRLMGTRVMLVGEARLYAQGELNLRPADILR